MKLATFLKSMLVLRLIAAFKFVKALLVVGTGFGLLSLANPVIVVSLQQFTTMTGLAREIGRAHV